MTSHVAFPERPAEEILPAEEIPDEPTIPAAAGARAASDEDPKRAPDEAYADPLRPRKTRGVFDLTRQHYKLSLSLALLLALGVALALVRAPIYQQEGTVDAVFLEQEVIDLGAYPEMERMNPTRQPPRPPLTEPTPRQAWAGEQHVVSDDADLEEEASFDATLDVFAPVDPATPPAGGATAPLPPPPASEPAPEDEEPELFVVVEEMPRLIGGLGGLQQQLNYPEIARRAGVEGRVFVQFVVDEQGRVHDPVVIRGIGAGCDEEAIRVVQQAQFEPGRQRGRPVRVLLALSVNFRLTD